MLRSGFQKKSKYGVAGTFAMRLIVVILTLLISGCAVLNKSAETDSTPVKTMSFNGVEYWCLEKTDFTSVLQEASRECN